MEDAHIAVLQMATNDMIGRQLRLWPLHPEVLEWYLERDEKGLPFMDWSDAEEHRYGMQPNILGQTIDFEWYHGQYNLLARALSFFVWLKQIMENQNGANP